MNDVVSTRFTAWNRYNIPVGLENYVLNLEFIDLPAALRMILRCSTLPETRNAVLCYVHRGLGKCSIPRPAPVLELFYDDDALCQFVFLTGAVVSRFCAPQFTKNFHQILPVLAHSYTGLLVDIPTPDFKPWGVHPVFVRSLQEVLYLKHIRTYTQLQSHMYTLETWESFYRDPVGELLAVLVLLLDRGSTK